MEERNYYIVLHVLQGKTFQAVGDLFGLDRRRTNKIFWNWLKKYGK